MEVRIVNREKDVITLGRRTLRNNGPVLVAWDVNGQAETIEAYESAEEAQGMKEYIGGRIKSAAESGVVEDLMIMLS